MHSFYFVKSCAVIFLCLAAARSHLFIFFVFKGIHELALLGYHATTSYSSIFFHGLWHTDHSILKSFSSKVCEPQTLGERLAKVMRKARKGRAPPSLGQSPAQRFCSI